MRFPRLRLLFLLLAAFGLLAAACGNDDDDIAVTGPGSGDRATDDSATDDGASLGDTDAFPVTVDSAGTELTIESLPDAIVSLSATTTEILYAVGAGDQVVAVDEYSNYPPDAPTTELSGFTPNVEAIATYEPDLVVMSDDRDDIVSNLRAIGIPALVVPSSDSLEETYDRIEIVGAATGRVGDAAELVSQMQQDIDELVAQVPDYAVAPTYYHEIGPDLYTATSDTFIGAIYSLAGLQNVADAADSDGAFGGYPQLQAEFLVDADPDFIFLATTKCCGQNLETVSQRAGFDTMTAVAEGRVIELDDDIASRWGPRVVDLLRVIVEATMPVTAG